MSVPGTGRCQPQACYKVWHLSALSRPPCAWDEGMVGWGGKVAGHPFKLSGLEDLRPCLHFPEPHKGLQEEWEIRPRIDFSPTLAWGRLTHFDVI